MLQVEIPLMGLVQAAGLKTESENTTNIGENLRKYIVFHLHPTHRD
jgi:protein involved in polysaccharide export with SLBB domain